MLSKGPTMLPEVPAMLSSEDPNSYPALRAAMLSEVPTMLSVSSEGPYGIRGPYFLYILYIPILLKIL